MKTLLCNVNLNKLNNLHTILASDYSVQICDCSFATSTTNKPFGYEARENICRGFPS